MRAIPFVLLFFAAGAAAAEDKVNGNWQGTLRISAIEMRLGFVVSSTTGGKLAGSCFSVDQNNVEIPVSTVTFENGTLTMLLPKIQAEYRGKLSENGKQIEGTFTQAGMKLPLTLKKVDKLMTLVRPQEPRPPYPYRAEDVTFENATAKIKLAGTVTLPPGPGPFPAVVLISGSGPQDRDETLMGHKPFKLIADYLTRRGVVVLRYDDRGMGGSKGSFEKATTFDFAEDTFAAVNYLKGRKEIDGKRIGLIGHSEGGIIAPIVATKCPDVAFIVLLAGTGLPGEEILYLQSRLICEAMGVKPEDAKRSGDLQRRLFTLAKAEEPSADLVRKLKAVLKEELDKLGEADEKALLTAGPEAAYAQLGAFAQPWFKTFIIHDPRPVLMKVKCPVLAVNGEKDLQVPWKENLEAIEKALREGGNTQVTVKAFPNLNHLFQTCKTGAPTEYGKIEETIHPAVLETIAEWIAARCR
jgi:uncharacterized protein